MRSGLRYATAALAVGIGTVIFYGCGSNTSSDYSYQGLGSKWTASFTGGSNFALTYDSQPDGTVDLTVNGTYVEFSNKFRKLTVTSASGSGAPSAGSVAYGLEIPGFAFFLKPMDSNSEPIVMVNSGSCPTGDFNANWIIAKFNDSSSPKVDSDAFGQAIFSVAGKTATITRTRFDNASDLSNNSINLISCSAGTQTFDDGGSGGTMYVTSNGGMLVNPGNGIIFASPVGSADPTSADWSGTFSGIVFNGNAGSSDKVFPAKVVMSGTGGTGTKITDVEADTLESGGVTFASLTAKAGKKGIFNGTVDGRPLNCVLSTPGGTKVLACNGASGAANGSGVFPTFFFLGTAR